MANWTISASEGELGQECPSHFRPLWSALSFLPISMKPSSPIQRRFTYLSDFTWTFNSPRTRHMKLKLTDLKLPQCI